MMLPPKEKNNFDFSTANVKTIVEAFERDNPQWNAIVAINGDFFDMENTVTATYGEPEFPMVQLGDVYKSNALAHMTGRGLVGTDADGNRGAAFRQYQQGAGHPDVCVQCAAGQGLRPHHADRGLHYFRRPHLYHQPQPGPQHDLPPGARRDHGGAGALLCGWQCPDEVRQTRGGCIWFAPTAATSFDMTGRPDDGSAFLRGTDQCLYVTPQSSLRSDSSPTKGSLSY